MEADDVSFDGSNVGIIYPKGLSEKSKIGQAIGSSQLYMKVQDKKE